MSGPASDGRVLGGLHIGGGTTDRLRVLREDFVKVRQFTQIVKERIVPDQTVIGRIPRFDLLLQAVVAVDA